MYELDSQKLTVARSTTTTDPAVQIWTPANKDGLAIQAIALMDRAGVPLPPGTIDDLVSVRVPALQSSGVDTEFHPWSNHELQVAVARGAKHNLGEVRLGENAQASRILQDWSGMNDNQVRLFQLRVLIHELFHVLDFGDVVRLTAGDHDHAIVMQSRELGFSSNRAAYSRNEIDTDLRTGLVLERNGLMFAELRRSLDEYRLYWQAQGPMAAQAFASALARLNRTSYP